MIDRCVGLIAVVICSLALMISPGRADTPGDPLPNGAVERIGSKRLNFATYIRHLNYSPDGKQITVSVNGDTLLIDAATAKTIATFPGTDAVFSADGTRLATLLESPEYRPVGPPDETPVVYDLKTQKQLIQLQAGPANAFAFAPDGKSAAVAMYGGSVQLFDLGTGKRTAEMKRPGNYTVGEHSFIQYAPDGKSIISLYRGIFVVWDCASKSVRFQTQESVDVPTAGVHLLPDGKTVLTAISSGQVFTRDLQKPQESSSDAAAFKHVGNIESCIFSADAKKLFCVVNTAMNGAVTQPGERNITNLLMVEIAGGSVTVLGENLPDIYGIALSPDGKTLITGGADCTVHFWNTQTEMPMTTSADASGALCCAAISPDRKMVAIGGMDGVIRLSPLEGGKPAQTLVGHQTAVMALAFSPDGQRLASCDHAGGLKLWNTQTLKLVPPPPEDPEEANRSSRINDRPFVVDHGSLCWSADGQLLAMQTHFQPRVFNRDGVELVSRELHPPFPAICAGLTFQGFTDFQGARLPEFSDTNPSPAETIAEANKRLRSMPRAQRDALPHWQDHIKPMPMYRWSVCAVSPDRKTIATGFEDTLRTYNTADASELKHDGTALVWDIGAAPPPVIASTQTPEQLWQTILGDDPEQATDAIPLLAKNPKATVAIVQKFLNTACENAKAAQLISALESDDFLTRFTAMQSLSMWWPSNHGAELGLVRYILREQNQPRACRLAMMLLEGMDPGPHAGNINATADLDRVVRLIALLEKAGDEGSQAILLRCAQRLPERRGGGGAYDALKRLGRSGKDMVAVVDLSPIPPLPTEVAAGTKRDDPAKRFEQAESLAKLLHDPQMVQTVNAQIAQAENPNKNAFFPGRQPQGTVGEDFQLQLRQKDFAGAFKTVSAIKDEFQKKSCMAMVAAAAEKGGDKPTAISAYDMLLDRNGLMLSGSSDTLPAVHLAKLGRGDLVAEAAKNTFPQDVGSSMLDFVVNAMLSVGDQKNAQVMLENVAARLPKPAAMNYARADAELVQACVHMASLQLRAMDKAGATKSIEVAEQCLATFRAADKTQAVYPSPQAIADVAAMEAKVGRRVQYTAAVDRLKTAGASSSDPGMKYVLLATVAILQADGDDTAGANETVKVLPNDEMSRRLEPFTERAVEKARGLRS